MNSQPTTPPLGPVAAWLAARIRWHLSFIPEDASVFTSSKKQICWWSVHLCFALPWVLALALLRLPSGRKPSTVNP
jgi:hypothetical protein